MNFKCSAIATEQAADLQRRSHSVKAGLAFDIVKLLPNGGIDYNDQQFWNAVGQIGKRIGFNWGLLTVGLRQAAFPVGRTRQVYG